MLKIVLKLMASRILKVLKNGQLLNLKIIRGKQNPRQNPNFESILVPENNKKQNSDSSFTNK